MAFKFAIYPRRHRSTRNLRRNYERQLEHDNSNANSDAVESITEAPGVEPTSKNTSSSGTCVKVLGIGWNEISDKICYDLGELVEYAKSLPPTKRSVLKLSANILDPIGHFTPFTVTIKM